MIIEIKEHMDIIFFKIILPMILVLLVCWSVFGYILESELSYDNNCLFIVTDYNFVIDEIQTWLSYINGLYNSSFLYICHYSEFHTYIVFSYKKA